MEIRYDKSSRKIQLFTGSSGPKAKKQMMSQEARIEEQNKKISQLQHLIIDDNLSVQEEGSVSYAGNKYRTYSKAVKEIDQKYRARAAWGVLQTGAIIDVRAAFIIGQGVKFTVDEPEKNKKEKEWVDHFVEFNDLGNEVPQELAKEAEIEGKFLGKLWMDEKEQMVSMRFVSWTGTGYVVKTNPQDYMDYQRVTWLDDGRKVTLGADQFVYKRFGGRIDIPNETPPKIAKCLTQIEFLDKAIRDWREIDRMYASPTPHVTTETAADAQKMQVAFEALNWKIKKFFAHTGTFEYLQIDANSILALKDEIVSLAKMISGTTGVPVHFLGLPDLMSNRNTADSLMELIVASTTKERQVWIGGWGEIIDKAASMWTKATKKTAIDTSKIRVEVPFITQSQWDRIKDVYLPMNFAGKLTDVGLFAQIPGFDAEGEIDRVEKEQNNVIKSLLNPSDKDLDEDKRGDE